MCDEGQTKLDVYDWVLSPEIREHMRTARPLTIEEKADILYDAGAKNVIVTLGENGCYLRNCEMKKHFSAANFHAVDTTGAGDAFISALAVYLSEEHDIVSAIQFATYAAGLSVTRDGAQPALTDRSALEIYSNEYNAC